MDCAINVAKTKALISFAVTAKLICVFVFAYAKSRFSYDPAHIFQTVFSINRSYVNILTKDQNFKTWQCKCAEEDISRLSHHVLGIKSNTTPEWEAETWDIGQIEHWLPKTHIFLIMFERVWQELFNINSVSIQGPVVLN